MANISPQPPKIIYTETLEVGTGLDLLRYHGVLAPHASHRVLVVPEPEKETDNQLGLPGLEEEVEDTEPSKPKRSDWASLLARVFKVDASVCPRCGGTRSRGNVASLA